MSYYGEHKEIYTCICCVCGDKFKAKRSYAKYCTKPHCRYIRAKKSHFLHDYKHKRNYVRIVRWCLRCDKKFLARGKYNRLCDECNSRIKSYNMICEGDFGICD